MHPGLSPSAWACRDDRIEDVAGLVLDGHGRSSGRGTGARFMKKNSPAARAITLITSPVPEWRKRTVATSA